MPAGTVYVGRPSRWGNWLRGPDAAAEFAAELAARERGAAVGTEATAYPSLAEVRTQLAGRDLACWCRPDQPCHADVLLQLANDPQGGTPC